MRTSSLKHWTRAGAVFLGLVGALLLAGCKTGRGDSSGGERFADLQAPISQPASPAATAAAAPVAAPATLPAAGTNSAWITLDPFANREVIRVGDLLTITYSDLPYLQQPSEERVKADGTITLIQNQTFTAAGKSLGVLEREIRDRYVPKIFVSLTVSVKPQRDSQFYFVGGEVKAPGRQLYISRITVSRAIQSAGDFTDFASKRKVRVTRVNGKVEIVNCVKALEDPTLDPEVFPGDKIHVPRKLF